MDMEAVFGVSPSVRRQPFAFNSTLRLTEANWKLALPQLQLNWKVYNL